MWLIYSIEGHIQFRHVHGNSTFPMSNDADGAINNTIGFVILRWLFAGYMTLVPVLIPLLASVSHAIGITCCWWCQWWHMTKNHFTLILFVLTWEIQWFHWWCNWYHVMPISMASHEEKVFLLQFDHLDLIKLVAQLTMLFASYGANTNSIPGTKVILHLIWIVLT